MKFVLVLILGYGLTISWSTNIVVLADANITETVTPYTTTEPYTGPCPRRDWKQFQGYCYYDGVDHGLLTFQEAVEACASFGPNVTLVSIHNQRVHDYVTSKIRGHPTIKWIGLVRLAHDNSMHWSDGTPFDFKLFNHPRTPWPRPPSVINQCYYVYIDWEERNCGWPTHIMCQRKMDCGGDYCQNGVCYNWKGGYQCDCQDGFSGQFCQHEIDECESSPCWNSGTCSDQINGYTCTCKDGFVGNNCQYEVIQCPDSKWERYEFDCIFYSTSVEYNFMEADSECRELGGPDASLAIIHSEDTFHFLKRIIVGPAWIGLWEGSMEGEYEWLDKTQVDFANWENQTDNDLHGCVYMNTLPGDWTKTSCATKLGGFVCMVSAVKLTAAPVSRPRVTEQDRITVQEEQVKVSTESSTTPYINDGQAAIDNTGNVQEDNTILYIVCGVCGLLVILVVLVIILIVIGVKKKASTTDSTEPGVCPNSDISYENQGMSASVYDGLQTQHNVQDEDDNYQQL